MPESPDEQPCPLTRDALLDRYFLEHRAKLLDLAAFLDRSERAADTNDHKAEDFRLAAMKNAVALLIDDQPQRTRRILELLSDPTTTLLDHAPGKGATGAAPPLTPDHKP